MKNIIRMNSLSNIVKSFHFLCDKRDIQYW